MSAIQLPVLHYISGPSPDGLTIAESADWHWYDAAGNHVPGMAQFIITANNTETDPFVMWVYCAAWWPEAVGYNIAAAYRNASQTVDQAMAAYNARSKNIDPKWLEYIAHAQMYFTGDTPFRPGSPWGHADTLLSAIKQWGQDAASPGWMDAIVDAGPLIVLAAATAGASGMFDSFSATGAGAGSYVEPGSILSDVGSASGSTVGAASTVSNIGTETATLPGSVSGATSVLPTLSAASPTASTASLLKQFASLYTLASSASSPQKSYTRNPGVPPASTASLLKQFASSPQKSYTRNPGVPPATTHASLADHLNQLSNANPSIDNAPATWQGYAKFLIPLALAVLAFR